MIHRAFDVLISAAIVSLSAALLLEACATPSPAPELDRIAGLDGGTGPADCSWACGDGEVGRWVDYPKRCECRDCAGCIERRARGGRPEWIRCCDCYGMTETDCRVGAGAEAAGPPDPDIYLELLAQPRECRFEVLPPTETEPAAPVQLCTYVLRTAPQCGVLSVNALRDGAGLAAVIVGCKGPGVSP